MKSKDWIKIIILLIIAYLLPKLSLFYLICGLLDFKRSNKFDGQTWRRYFLGNGVLVWLLSPFNLLMDLLSYKNKGVYKLNDLPKDYQIEIKQLIEIAKHKPEIIDELSKCMEEKRRGMIFFKWYGKNIANNLNIPEFHQPFNYITTIGVSIFNKNQATSIHYGPLRITFRVLYNLIPLVNDNVYIQVGKHKHLWHDDPLFIFDDTLIHQSVNGSDQLRYCMFIDILRPSPNLNILKFILKGVRIFIISFNRVFYKNWEIIK